MGQLAEAFNRMARQLRDYRESHSARLLRVQRTSQATIDSFPDPVLVVDPGGRVEMANPAAHRLAGDRAATARAPSGIRLAAADVPARSRWRTPCTSTAPF